MKFSRTPTTLFVISVCFLIRATLTGLMAEERTSATSARPFIRDPKELGYEVNLITAEELKKLMDEGSDITIVDTQDERIFPLKHIKGSINFPWAAVIKEPINLPRNKLLIIYCGCAGEEASKEVARQLMANWGFQRIKVLEGGFIRWLKLHYPIESRREERAGL